MADRLPFAVLQFDKLTDSLLANYGQNVVDGLGSVAGLALYPAPPIIPATLQLAVTQFVNAMAAAADGGVPNTLNKNAVRLVLQSQLRSNVRYVTQVAQGGFTDYDDIRAKIAISGFLPSAIPEPLSSLPAPEIQFAQSTGIGMLQVRLKSHPGVTAYITMYKKSTDTNYSTFLSTSSRFKIKGLQSAVTYNVIYVYKGTTNTVVTETDVIDYVIL